MDRTALQQAQEPLKARYRDDPTSGVITLRSTGTLGDGITCSVEVGRAITDAGLHPATGGDGVSACSGDMLLQALVACAGVTLAAVATNRDIDVQGTVSAEGDLDVRGTLGVDRDAPVGFGEIRLTFALESTADADQLDALIKTTERYCVVLQTLVNGPRIHVSRSA